jgi:hypothetical protein
MLIIGSIFSPQNVLCTAYLANLKICVEVVLVDKINFFSMKMRIKYV